MTNYMYIHKTRVLLTDGGWWGLCVQTSLGPELLIEGGQVKELEQEE